MERPIHPGTAVASQSRSDAQLDWAEEPTSPINPPLPISELLAGPEPRIGGMKGYLAVWMALTALVVAGAGLSVYWLALPSPASLREDELIRQLATGSEEGSTELVLELARRGESQIPRIMDAFVRARGKSQLQIMLAESVSRIYPPTNQTLAALEKMHELSEDTEEVAAPIAAFLSDCRAELLGR